MALELARIRLAATCTITNPTNPRYSATCPVCKSAVQLFYDSRGVLCKSACEHFRELRAYESNGPHMVFTDDPEPKGLAG